MGSLWLLAAATAQANCTEWNSRQGTITVEGLVSAMTVWDRDGAGPLPPLWVFGGQFTTIGGIVANRIATFDPATSTWAPLGTGLTNPLFGGPYVTALATLPNGELIVGGTFAEAGGVYAANGVARWDGTSWNRLGLGTPGSVYSLAVMPNGDLVIGGDFTLLNTTISRIARWDGVAWSALGSGINFAPKAMTVAPNGDLLAAGPVFGSTGTVQTSRWNGSAWSPMGPAFPGVVNDLVHLPNGTPVLGGGLFFGPITYGAMSWNGTNWSPFGGLLTGVFRLTRLANGDLVAMTNQPLRWNGSTWTPIAPVIDGNLLAVLPNDELVLRGREGPSWNSPYRLYRSAGGPWQPIGRGIDGYITQLVEAPDGDVVAGGAFTLYPSGIKNLARWNGSGWSTAATTIPPSIQRVMVRSNGALVLAADFSQIVGPGCGIAEWSGSAWTQVGDGSFGGSILTAALSPSGDVLIAGYVPGPTGPYRAARWNGATWQPLGNQLPGSPYSLTGLPDGSVVADTAGGVVRFDGSGWAPFGTGILSPGSPLRVQPDGSLLAGSGDRVYRYQGGTWQPIGTPQGLNIRDLLQMPNGDILTGVYNSGSSLQQSALRRWNGTTWSDVGPIRGLTSNSDTWVWQLAQPRSGEVVIAGIFGQVAGQPTNGFVRLQSTCPATSAPLGAGCAASGAAANLSTTALPWLGSTFRAEASNLPAAAIAVVVTGFTSINQTLGSLLPPSPAACTLWVAPDALSLAAVTSGNLGTSLVIPDQSALLGVVFHQQVVAVELDAQAAPVQSLATNALTLTVGAF